MVDTVVSTLTREALDAAAKKPQVNPINTDKEALFDSIAHEVSGERENSESSTLKTFFTAVLWTGYAIAIVVSVILVWSAAKELLR